MSLKSHVDWEDWVSQRFVAYIRDAARGAEHPSEAVRRVLQNHGLEPTRYRLGCIAYMGRDGRAQRILTWLAVVERWLSDYRRTTQPVQQASRGVVRGQVHSGRTVVLQARTGDTTQFVASQRKDDLTDLQIVRSALDALAEMIEAVDRPYEAAEKDWRKEWSDMARQVRGCRKAAVFSIPGDSPSAAKLIERFEAHSSPLLREAAEILRDVERIRRWPENLDELVDAVSKFGLVPTDQSRSGKLIKDKKFELFALLAISDVITALRPNYTWTCRAIELGREAAASWRAPVIEGGAVVNTISLYFDTPIERSVSSDILSYYFEDASGKPRPDLRLVCERGGKCAVLYIDAKYSESVSYMRDAYNAMLAYSLDELSLRGLNSALRGIVVTLKSTRAKPPRFDHSVVFVDPSGCVHTSHLSDVLRVWLDDAEGALLGGPVVAG